MRFSRLLAWLLVLAAGPALAEASPSLRPLEQRLTALASESAGEYGMAALDLQTGEMVSVNGSRPFPMASTVKVAVAATFLSQVDAGQRDLDDAIGGTPARSLLEAMIIHSDNHATDRLIAALGGPAAVETWLRRHRLTGIRVDRTIAQLLAARRDLHDVRDSATPVAMLGLLRTIDSGNALSADSRDLLLDLMRRCATGANRIRGQLPSGALVEHKTGTLNGFTGDVGFLTYPDGRRIAVAFFARGGTDRPAVIAAAARDVWFGFGAPDLQLPYDMDEPEVRVAQGTGFGEHLVIQATSRQNVSRPAVSRQPISRRAVPRQSLERQAADSFAPRKRGTAPTCLLSGTEFQGMC